MPIPETHEEFVAKRINARNYSAILAMIYALKRRQSDEYIPSAFNRVIPSSSAVGVGSASAIFNAISPLSFTKGTQITLSGTATYEISSGGSLLAIKPAIKITAQIDIGRSGPPDSLQAYQVECKASEIDSNGVFSFVIPSQITSLLSVGKHTVYIDAHSPDNPPVRLNAPGATNGQREFTITT